MRPVTVVGAGGIGCAVGYALRVAGVPVTFVDANPEKVAWGNSHGVGIEGMPDLRAEFVWFPDWRPGPEPVVLLCTKCYDNAAVLERLTVPVTLIPIQNGFDRRLPVLPGSVEGIASFVSECLPGQTRTRITRAGRLHLGFRQVGPDGGVLKELAGCLRGHAPFRISVVPDILPYKYTKLMYNAAISPLAAAAGLDNGALLSVPLARRLFFDLIQENYAILEGAGVPLGKVGPFHPRTVRRILAHRWLARALAWAFYPTLRGTYCSMSGDLPAGRTEIDHYNGHLIELAGNRPCPLNRRVHALVKGMEQRGEPPDFRVLERLAA